MNTPHQTKRQNLDLALIGNSCSAALVDRNARIVWWCFPYFDSDPVFSRLLADDEEKGFCDVVVADLVETESRYLRNTAIVETIMTDARGAQLRIADFAPRFDLFEREYRSPQIIRRIEPLAGLPASPSGCAQPTITDVRRPMSWSVPTTLVMSAART